MGRLPNAAFAPGKEPKSLPEHFAENGPDEGVFDPKMHSFTESHNNPHRVICRACGQSEYFSRPVCRCGESIDEQLQDMYWDWKPKEHARLVSGSRRAAKISNAWLIGCVVPLAIFIVSVSFEPNLFDYFHNLYPPVFFLLVGGMAYSQHLNRRSAALLKRSDELNEQRFIEAVFR